MLHPTLTTMVDIRVSQKTKSPNFVSQLAPLVFIGEMSHQKKFQQYRPINDIEQAIFSFTL